LPASWRRPGAPSDSRTPLVVVPAHDLEQIAVDDFRELRSTTETRGSPMMSADTSGGLALLERAGALEHHVDTELAPRELRRIARAERPQPSARDTELAVLHGDGLRITAVHRVETKQVGQVLRVDEVVDRDELEPGLVDEQLQNRTADPAQPVDCRLAAHADGLRVSLGLSRWPAVCAAVFAEIVCKMSSYASTNLPMPSSSRRSVTRSMSIP